MRKLILGTIAASAFSFAQISLPLSDPARTANVRIDTMRGDVVVRAGDGKEVVIEQRSTGKNAKPARESKRSDGLKRIDLGGADINAHEQNNTVTITSRHAGSDISVVVPRSSNLTLKTLDGEITVEGVQGQIEANSLNGEVTMRSVSGTVIAHSLNGDVRVTLDRVEAKPMSFSTMNGDIDVTLPPDIKARFKMRNDHGDLFSDFDMTVEAAGPQVSETGGSRKIRFERTAYANVNGGGPEVSFRTVNGEIRIRKHK